MTFLKDRPFYLLFGIVSLVGFAADQASKYVVFAKLYPAAGQIGVVHAVIPGYFDLLTHWTDKDDPGDQPLSFLRTISGKRLPELNKGALFGLGNARDGSGGWNNVFLAISVLAAGFVIYWAARPAVAQDRYLCLALGLILGGTLGNLYDRAVFGGVRDFLHCYIQFEGDVQPRIWPDFNIADACLVCGAGILLVHSFFVKEPEPAKPEPAAATTETPAPQPIVVTDITAQNKPIVVTDITAQKNP
jgi:lipoprotein signal peptidase